METNRIHAPIVLTLLVTAFAFTVPAAAEEPWTGEVGVTRTTEDIMSAQASAPARAPKLMRELEYPDRTALAQHPSALKVSRIPDATPARLPQAVTAPLSPQTVGTTFDGATLSVSAFPPDTMGTVGPTQFIVFVNGRIRSFNKSTGVADGVLNANPDTFFSTVMTPVSGSVVDNFTSDPRIRYDRLTGRWILIIIDVPCTNAQCTSTAANRVLIGVSSSSTISGATTWTYYYFQQDLVAPAGNSGGFLDYPTLGVDANALYIGGNMFTGAGSWSGTSGFVVRKSSILSGGPIVAAAFRNLASGSGAGPYTPQGVDNFDPSATEGYFIGVDNANSGILQLRRVSSPGGTPTISGNVTISVSTTSTPLTVPHSGNTGGNNGKLDALDDRLFAAHFRNGRLWTAHNIAVNSSGVATSGDRDGVRWYELQGIPTGSTPSVVQSATVYSSAASNPAFYWIPSVMVSGQGHAALGFSQAGAATRIDADTVGRLSGDTLGTLGTIATYTSSGTAYNPSGDPGGTGGRRWGDYSYTSLDPIDDMTMWTVQQYCNASNSYAVRVAKLIAPPPATPTGSATLLSSTANQVFVITGASTSGSGFFDPGANLPGGVAFNHISAAVSPSTNVTVNSVTYTDPTHLTVNITTTGAITGARDLVVTNPDGQSVTATGYFLAPAALTAAVSGSATICAGSSTQIQAALTGSSPWDVTWSDSVTQNGVTTSPAVRTVSPASTTTYTVTSVTNGSGSGTASGSAAITVTPRPATPTAANGGPTCAGATLNLTTATVGGATYAWTGPNGFTSSSQNPSITSATTAASGTYSVTVTVSGCTSLAGTTSATVNADTAAPTVTAASAVTIDQTLCCGTFGGVTPASSAALSTFVNGGSATDDCTASPTRLPAQVGGADVTSATCFQAGATTVTFRFQDTSGKTGTATATATIRMFADLNLDGVVDPSDTVILRAYFNFVVTPGTAPFLAPLGMADLTHNATVDPADLVVLRSYLNFVVTCLAP